MGKSGGGGVWCSKNRTSAARVPDFLSKCCDARQKYREVFVSLHKRRPSNTLAVDLNFRSA